MKDKLAVKKEKRQSRAARTRAKIFGTGKKPRLSVFRSNKHVYAQLINDEKSITVASVSDMELKAGKKTKTEVASMVGEALAKKALGQKIDSAIFDKGGYKYHGIVKSLAEGARKGGLKF